MISVTDNGPGRARRDPGERLRAVHPGRRQPRPAGRWFLDRARSRHRGSRRQRPRRQGRPGQPPRLQPASRSASRWPDPSDLSRMAGLDRTRTPATPGRAPRTRLGVDGVSTPGGHSPTLRCGPAQFPARCRMTGSRPTCRPGADGYLHLRRRPAPAPCWPREDGPTGRPWELIACWWHRRPLPVGPLRFRVRELLLLGSRAGRFGELDGLVLRLPRRRQQDHRRQAPRRDLADGPLRAAVRAELVEHPRPRGTAGRGQRRRAVRRGAPQPARLAPSTAAGRLGTGDARPTR